MSGTVTVSAHDLHRLLLEFRRLLQRGDATVGSRLGSWRHGVDYDNSFERLADILDEYHAARGLTRDTRTRCNHDNPVYWWPDNTQPVTWVPVRASSADAKVPARQRHLVQRGADPGQWRWKTLCGMHFVREDVVKKPRAAFPECAVCEREQWLRQATVVDGAQS